MITEGKAEIRALCSSSNYPYNEELVDSILAQEEEARQKLTIRSSNVWRYPAVRLVVLKLSVVYGATNMLYYGIILGGIPGGVLLNNAILGLLSLLSSPAMNLLLYYYANRREILSGAYILCGIAVIIMGCLAKFEGRYALIKN